MRPPKDVKKLGQLLVERGWVTGEQLIRAIQSQRVVGGRIGTCLLEMDVLSEDRLLDALKYQLSVPAAHIAELRNISEGVLQRIPPKVAARWQAVPFLVTSADIRVATLNAKNLACLDELRFCTDLDVIPHIANEIRIFEALEKHYGLECPRRYGHLLDRLNRARYLWTDPGQSPPVGESASEAVPAIVPEIRDETADLLPSVNSWSTLGAAREALRQEPPATATAAGAGPNGGGPPSPTTAHLTLDEVGRQLADKTDHKSIGEILVRFLGQSFSRSAIFTVKRRRVYGWLHHGDGFDAPLFGSLDLGLDQPSAFLGLVEGAEFYLGALAPLPAHRLVARCWGGELPRQCLMIPIRVRGRVILILYGDCGADNLLNPDLEQLMQLAERAAVALELCILRNKLQKSVRASS